VRLYAVDDKSHRTIALAWRKGSSREDEFRMLGAFLRDIRRKAAK
jgi:hypothetical protein